MAEKRRVRVGTGKPVAQPDFSVPAGKRDAARETLVDDPDACRCPRLERMDWHEVESDWSDATFVRTSMNAALGVPLGYQQIRGKLAALAAKASATVPDDAMVLLGEGKFRRPVLLEVEDAPAGAPGIERPGGISFSRLVPAPMGQMKSAVNDTVDAARERYGRKPDAIWLWYLTCRICSAARDFETLVLAHYRDVPQST